MFDGTPFTADISWPSCLHQAVVNMWAKLALAFVLNWIYYTRESCKRTLIFRFHVVESKTSRKHGLWLLNINPVELYCQQMWVLDEKCNAAGKNKAEWLLKVQGIYSSSQAHLEHCCDSKIARRQWIIEEKCAVYDNNNKNYGEKLWYCCFCEFSEEEGWSELHIKPLDWACGTFVRYEKGTDKKMQDCHAIAQYSHY